MENVKVLVLKQMRGAWRRRWLAIAAAWGVCALGWLVVASLPNQYESQARVYVDADAVLTPLLRGLAADTNALNQVDLMQRTLLSAPNLDKLIRMTDLEQRVGTDQGAREALIQKLQQDIKIKSQAKNLFTITYRDPSPRLARDVVNALLTIFQEGNVGAGRTAMDNAQKFLKDQLGTYERQLRDAEKRRAEFRAKYIDILPAENGGASRLETARANVENLNLELSEAIARRDAIAAQLKSTPASVSGGVGGGLYAQAQQKLAELRMRFTDQHPDVIAARRQVEELSRGAGGTSVGNPTYDMIKLRLVDAESQIAAMKNRLAQGEKERDRIDSIARAAPGVAAEYQNLDRDYTVIRKNYEELLTRREATNIAEAADAKADKIQYRVIDPPEIAFIPVAPKRTLLVTGVLLAGIAAAGALIFVLNQLDRSFANLDDLRSLGLPVIGGLSKLPNTGARAMDRAGVIFVASIGALLVVYAFFVAGGAALFRKVI
ncbi:XrtA system polysaccharide chain length determinant [Roseiterribacter gracilis]|uniref:Chain-length determining protein n=1 Tax=Roseiterribacter gracilis TaxID=2812848 RepID=A0A8S8X6A3_9PROT|nr:chain-length determining protein [Rhodospirillales bacterium TMPK1]